MARTKAPPKYPTAQLIASRLLELALQYDCQPVLVSSERLYAITGRKQLQDSVLARVARKLRLDGVELMVAMRTAPDAVLLPASGSGMQNAKAAHVRAAIKEHPMPATPADKAGKKRRVAKQHVLNAPVPCPYPAAAKKRA